MVPDVVVLCMIALFGASVIQRVAHMVSHDLGSTLRSIYGKTGLLLDISILGLQAFCKACNCDLFLTPACAHGVQSPRLQICLILHVCSMHQHCCQILPHALDFLA